MIRNFRNIPHTLRNLMNSDYLKWAERCGVNTTEVLKRIKAGEDSNKILSDIKTSWQKGMSDFGGYDFEDVWDGSLKTDFEILIEDLQADLTPKEIKANEKITGEIKGTSYIISGDKVIVNGKIVKEFKTDRQIKYNITYFKNRYSKTTKTQKIILKSAMTKLRQNLSHMSNKDRDKFLTMKRV